MKLFYLFLSICVSLAASAQVSLSLTARGDVASTFGYSDPMDQGYSNPDNKTIGDRASFGIELLRFTKKNQAVIYGIEYATSGYDYTEPVWFGEDDFTQPATRFIKGIYRYDYIAVPLGYRWYSSGKKWRLYGQLSLIPMVYVRTKKSTIYGDFGGVGEFSRGHHLQSYSLATSAAFGLERSIFKRLTIGFQPTFRTHIISVTNAATEERPWTAGMQLNVGWKLPKT